MKKPYLPRVESERITWLNNFSSKLGGYAPKFGVTPEEVKTIVNMAIIYSYIINLITSSKTFTKSLTSFKNTLSIAKTGTVLGDLPTFDEGMVPDLTGRYFYIYCRHCGTHKKQYSQLYGYHWQRFGNNR